MSKQRDANQRLFTEAWEHIHAQGCASVAEETGVSNYDGGFCRYQTAEGLGCAMAPAIEDYSPEMETCGASRLMREFADNLYPWARDASELFVTTLQRCHDQATLSGDRGRFMAEFEEAMRACAGVWDLEVPQ